MTKEEKLRARYNAELVKIEDQRLPGWEGRLAADPEAKGWMDKQHAKIQSAIRDEDEILFERGMNSWQRGWEKINRAIAEEYRKANPDAELWELRYVRWMSIKFMKLECDMGTFYIVPQRPKRKPRAKHWFTVDEILDILGSPATIAAIKMFGELPVRPESTREKIPAGEKHLIMDFTKDPPDIHYKWKGSVKRG